MLALGPEKLQNGVPKSFPKGVSPKNFSAILLLGVHLCFDNVLRCNGQNRPSLKHIRDFTFGSRYSIKGWERRYNLFLKLGFHEISVDISFSNAYLGISESDIPFISCYLQIYAYLFALFGNGPKKIWLMERWLVGC